MSLLSRLASLPKKVGFSTTSRAPKSGAFPVVTSVKIGAVVIAVETVSTKAAIDTGLSGRASLQAFPPQGMLFLFDHDAKFKFWMRGMHFSIDIIWIGADMKIVDISPNLPPLPDASEALFYSPRELARYVLEVPAGFCAEQKIQIGYTVEFQNT